MFTPIKEAIQAIAKGELLVLTDDENRENEGDLICAAQFATPQKINFMVSFGRGVLCVPVGQETAQRLKLQVPTGNHDPRGIAFSQSLDAIHHTTTGVSAFDRAQTIADILRSDSTIDDFYSPGHIYPLLGRSGGVLERTGHTEGTLDLVRLAGLPEVGVLCEILNDDGTMARIPDLEQFCFKYHLKMCSIADLVAFRKTHCC